MGDPLAQKQPARTLDGEVLSCFFTSRKQLLITCPVPGTVQEALNTHVKQELSIISIL